MTTNYCVNNVCKKDFARRKSEKCEGALIELLENTTIHGLNHVYTAKFQRYKILWLVLFILGLAGFGFNLIFIFKKYLSNPILVSRFIDNERFVWPDLTFCNPTAPYTLDNIPSAWQHWSKTLNDSQGIISKLANTSELFEFIKSYKNDKKEFAEKSVVMSTVNPVMMQVDKYEKSITFYGYSKSHSNIYLIKEYDQHVTDIMSNDTKIFFSNQMVQIRNNIPCYTFQMERSKTLNFDRIRSIVLLIKLDFLSYKMFNTNYMSRSVLLFISPKDQLPQTDEIIILPGFTNEISITQTHYEHNEVRSPCRNELYRVELYDSLLTSTKIYEGNFQDCKKVISQTIYVEHCHCYSPFLPLYKSNDSFPQLCLNASIFSESQIIANVNCMLDVYKNYSKDSVFKTIEKQKCRRYANVKCKDINYKTIVRKNMWVELITDAINDRTNMWMKKVYEKIFSRKPTGRKYLDEIRENVAMVSLKRISKYGDLFKEELEYSHSDLVSDIGGLMGFWLGLSVVGLFEISGMLYFMIMKVFLSCLNQIHKKHTISIPDDTSTFKTAL